MSSARPACEPPAIPARERGRDGRRALGILGERLAAEHLERRGYAILARNVRTRAGEIDLIAADTDTLAFVEVKTRRARAASAWAPDPLSCLRPRQRARVRRLAAAWLREPAQRQLPWAGTLRFDAIGVTVDARDRLLALEHLEGAW